MPVAASDIKTWQSRAIEQQAGGAPELDKAIESWTVGMHQGIQDDVADLIRSGAKINPNGSPAEAMLHALRHGDVTKDALYRGLQVDPTTAEGRLLLGAKKGQELQLLQPQSFSSSSKVAEGFMRGDNGIVDSDPSLRRVLVVTGSGDPTMGLHIGERTKFDGGDQQEFVANGVFKVVKSIIVGSGDQSYRQVWLHQVGVL